MTSSRELKQECEGCGGMFTKSMLHVYKQKEMCKACIKADEGRLSRPTQMDLTYHQMLRKQMGLV